jgi:hypothetical protein
MRLNVFPPKTKETVVPVRRGFTRDPIVFNGGDPYVTPRHAMFQYRQAWTIVYN